jgi:hypothetical protein
LKLSRSRRTEEGAWFADFRSSRMASRLDRSAPIIPKRIPCFLSRGTTSKAAHPRRNRFRCWSARRGHNAIHHNVMDRLDRSMTVPRHHDSPFSDREYQAAPSRSPRPRARYGKGLGWCWQSKRTPWTWPAPSKPPFVEMCQPVQLNFRRRVELTAHRKMCFRLPVADPVEAAIVDASAIESASGEMEPSAESETSASLIIASDPATVEGM